MHIDLQHTRRDFLKLSAVGAATALTVGSENLDAADQPRAPILGPYGFTTEIVPGLHVCAMMPPKLGLIPTYLGVCAYLIQNPGGRPFLIDSGMTSQTETLVDLLARHGVKPADIEIVACTHEHGDHTGGCAFFQQKGARIAIHEAAGEQLAGAAPFRPDVRFAPAASSSASCTRRDTRPPPAVLRCGWATRTSCSRATSPSCTSPGSGTPWPCSRR